MASGDTKRLPRVIIVGAGLAGITCGIQLKRKFGFENFTIYEKEDGVGGTWKVNTYPGCGSDVPGHWFSLSTDLNPNWNSYYVTQPELKEYWEGLWTKYNLAPKTSFNMRVDRAEWDDTTQRWTVTMRNGKTGEETTDEAEVLFWAIGGFQNPLYPPELEDGIKKFKGDAWHSARWNHSVDLKGKSVGVIGNACSSAQLIPEISADPSVQVINFCRSPNWFVPRPDYQYSAFVKLVFKHLPFVMRLYRNLIMARSDLSALLFRKDNKVLVALSRKALSSYIKKKAPKEYLEKLIPTYTPGCKRIIVDPGYLASLHRSNVSLNWNAIETIVENGVKLKSGEIIPLDVIIFGTGYTLLSPDLNVTGRNGKTMREYFDEQGGPTAYLGTSIPGFPNMFLLLGPNVATGHASVVFSEEVQINLAMQLIKPVLERKAKSFEIKEEVTNEYNTWLQERLQRSVWVDCLSYYRSRKQDGKIVATFPGPVTLYWWLARKAKWDRYKAVGAELWEKERKRERVRKSSILLLLALSAALAYVKLAGLRRITKTVASS